jgi:hypothetical protein
MSRAVGRAMSDLFIFGFPLKSELPPYMQTEYPAYHLSFKNV